MPVPMGVSDAGDYLEDLNHDSLVAMKRNKGGGTLSVGTIQTRAESKDPHRGAVGGETRANDLKKVGWGVIYSPTIMGSPRHFVAMSSFWMRSCRSTIPSRRASGRGGQPGT